MQVCVKGKNSAKILGGILSLCVWFSAHSAFAALTPAISTSQIRDFTRITFNWSEKVRFKVETLPQGVVLTFNQPASINLNAIRQGLGKTLTDSSVSSDGTRVSLQFNKPYRIRHFISGNANGIDILDSEATADEAAEPAQNDAPPVSQPLAFQPTPSDKPASPLRPDEPAQEQAQAAAPQPTPPPPAEPAMADTPPAETPAPPALQSQPLPATAEETAATTSETPPTPAPEPEAATQPESTPEPEPEPAPQPVANAPAESPAEEVETPVPAAAAPPAPAEAVEVVVDTSAPILPPEESEQPAAEEPSETPSEAAPSSPMPVSAPEPTDIAASQAQQNGENIEYEPIETIEPSEQALDIAGSNGAAGSGDAPFIVTTYSLATGTEIRFPWVERVAASVFTRGDAVWIVFNRERDLNLDLLRSIMPASVTNLQRVDVPGHTVLRLQTDGSVHAKVTKLANSGQWWVTLSVYRQLPPSPISIQPRPESATAPNLYIPSLEYANPITFTDPVIGDELIAVPFFNAGEGVYPSRSYPEIDILPSAQGMGLVKKTDFAEVRPLRNGLRISDRDGLSISSDLPELALAELEALQSESVTWFPYEQWRVDPENFNETRRDLENQLLYAQDVRANSLRLKLAQLYLGEGLANETLAWLQLIEENDPNYFKERKLIALRAAAHFLRDDYNTARALFLDPSLREHAEQKLWRDALRIFEEERPRFDYLDYFETYISKYPPLMREKLGILATDNYINRKSFSRALNTLDTLSLTGVRPHVVPYIDFLLGKIAAENGNVDGARQLWERLLETTNDRFVRARAQFALTTMLYTQGEIEIDEAIRQLDRLRIVWRGDSLELALLNYLGQLYMDSGDFLEGLRAWQELVQFFPETSLASAVAREMAETFNALFAEGKADGLEPLQALSIFYEFRQLTPVGQAGDEMIQNLANRLIDVDLLDRAAALLEHQIKFRQEKLARSKLGAQLALVYYLDRRPEDALETLELTGFGRMPRDLMLQRTRVAAMSLAEQEEYGRALEMLAPDGSREADSLRLAVYWKMREWPNVISVAESLLGSRDDMTAPLSAMETEYLLQLSIAYMLERERTQLQYLRNYFDSLIAEGPNKEIFRFVTDVSAPIDPQRFEMVAQQINGIETFMKNYRERIKEGGLSPVVN